MAFREKNFDTCYEKGIRMLARPVWPLCNLLILLYLAAEKEGLEDLAARMPEEVETQGIIYEKPAQVLKPYLPALKNMEILRGGGGASPDMPAVFSTEGQVLDMFDSLVACTQQAVLERELEKINSLLCGPCSCTLCCTGPAPDARQEYFEIPLLEHEIRLFDLPRIDSASSRACGPEDDPAFCVDGHPFFEHPPALYHWSAGWSMILSRGRSCPHLQEAGTCGIYPERPRVCRKPQIFPVVVEKPLRGVKDSRMIRQNALLAVWDCPYVKDLKEKILDYAGINELKMVFRENKA